MIDPMGILGGWRYCPRCAGGLRLSDGHFHCPACGSDYWANSIPAAQAVVERDGRVLLGRRTREPRLGHWDLPGGFLEEGEAPLDGLRRELYEETGLAVVATEWLGVFVDLYAGRSVLSLTWLVHATGEPRAADDIADLSWLAAADLPSELAFPSQASVLALWASRHTSRSRRLAR